VNEVYMDQVGKRVLLMGNEALARGAIEVGIDLAAAYPGTPSSEILETLIEGAKYFNYYVEWSANEKVAFEMAAGASILGARTVVSMKNAGLNVVMDALMTLVYGGVKGGMVMIVCDDPGAHYSSNEQDTRFAAIAAEIPCFEPKDQQEAKDMVKDAFEISERIELPVMVRSVSRLSHGNGDVTLGEIREESNPLGFNKHWKIQWRWNVYGPPGAIEKHRWIHKQLGKAEIISEQSKWNSLSINSENELGIIASGLACSYAKEAMDDLKLKADILNLGMSYPLPARKISKLLKSSKKVFVIEEGGSFAVERGVRSIAQNIDSHVKIYGKDMNPLLDPCGEINTEMVKVALSKITDAKLPRIDSKRGYFKQKQKKLISPRSSTLCAGCSHLGSYAGLRKALGKFKGVHILNCDIGCYEQAGYGIFAHEIDVNSQNSRRYKYTSVYEFIDTCYEMGSSLTMAEGQAKVGYEQGKIVAIMGDSTFYHAGLPGLVNGVYNNSDITFLILQNYWTAMTGHQPDPGTGLTSKKEPTEAIAIEEIVKGMGTKFLRVVDAYNIEEVATVIEEAIKYPGCAVVETKGECRLQYMRKVGKEAVEESEVCEDMCNGCRRCVQIGCPAVGFNPSTKKAYIDTEMCTGCRICGQICPTGAIRVGGEKKQ